MGGWEFGGVGGGGRGGCLGARGGEYDASADLLFWCRFSTPISFSNTLLMFVDVELVVIATADVGVDATELELAPLLDNAR